ncbi:MAG: hypothetical protein OHK0039_10000 [Bacteroidia bacterium]
MNLTPSIQALFRSRLLYGLLAVLGVVMLWWMLDQDTLGQLAQVLPQVQPGWLLLSMGFSLLSSWFRAMRWRLQVRALGYDLSPRESLALVFTGYAVNQFLPRGGEVLRCTLLARTHAVPFAGAFGTVITDRLLDMLVLLLLTVVAVVFECQVLYDWLLAPIAALPSLVPAALAGLALGAVVAIRWGLRSTHTLRLPLPALQRLATRLLAGMTSIRQVRPRLPLLLHTLGLWLAYWAMNLTALLSLGITADLPLSLSYFALLILVTGTLGVSVPTPGGMGPYHAAVMFTFVLFGMGTADTTAAAWGALFALLAHGSRMVALLLAGAIAYIWWVWHHRPAAPERRWSWFSKIPETGMTRPPEPVGEKP